MHLRLNADDWTQLGDGTLFPRLEPGRGKTLSIVRLPRILQTVAPTLGPLTEAERHLVEKEFFVQVRRFADQQETIQGETFLPWAYQDWYIVEQTADAATDWHRWYWRTVARIESKVLVRRKGTVRAGSRNGSQACCTHVMAIYESDMTTRWLLGLLPKFDRAVRSVRELSCIVSAWASARSRRVNNSNFELCAA